MEHVNIHTTKKHPPTCGLSQHNACKDINQEVTCKGFLHGQS